MEGRTEPTPNVRVIGQVAGDRSAVDVAVEDRHEDREASRGARRRFGRRRDGENGAVGGGDDRLLAAFRDPLGIAEERKEEKGENEKEGGDDRAPEDQRDGRESRRNENERPPFAGNGDPQ